MKKQKTKMSLLGIMVMASALIFSSCAKGFDDDETFTSTVTGAQLESPTLSKANFSSVVNADGSESVRVSWEAVTGAGGYAYRVDNIDSGEPVLIKEGETDKSYILFPKEDDTKYQVSVKTLGNDKLKNASATAATVFAYSTMVDAKIIPNGSDIAAFINANLTPSDDEQAFELEAGGKYTLDGEVDFLKQKMTLRGNKITKPIVTIGVDGVIKTAAALKVKWIKFDTTAQNSKGVIELSEHPTDDMKNTQEKAYYLPDPIIIEDCWFKNIKACLFYSGELAWGAEDVRVVNCLVQLDNDGSKFADAAIVGTCNNSYFPAGSSNQTWYGAIRNVTLKDNTFYNLKDNAKNRVIRFRNNNFAQVFPSSTGSATVTNNTFVKTMSDKEFANNTPNRNNYSITFNGNVLYICARLQKFLQGNCVITCDKSQNTSYTLPDKTGDGARFANDFNFCTEEDPGFDETALKELDLEAENGGVNFKAKGAISSTIGDPRWLQ